MLIVERLDGRRHDRDKFDCAEPSLNDYLRRQASQHHRAGIATTHVLVDDLAPSEVLGYYSLAAAQLYLTDIPVAEQRLPRYPIPAVRLARLAVLRREHGRGLGSALLQDAVTRSLALRQELGVRVLVVDADETARPAAAADILAPCSASETST